ncbi:DUF221-domain-containing protein [Hypoxylon fragiforme]|uniref:DUF221-domain-containing protein n=1 Tax=Hypoxylon fragiforme TaxID=63214 RepID=UPI0020C72E35|nr:DUF221-domain-containing protein [Hypoxylon fragiforme]KAI2607305.1 DUF221-domain-containing protein [Hypoxylon fragiforme]
MSEQGSAQDAEPVSAATLYLTLGPVALTAAAYLSVFLVLRKSQRRFYAPRTYLGSVRPSERTPALPNGLFNWIGPFWRMPDVHSLQHQSLDAYLFLRFLRNLVVICFVGCCIMWPVLFPVNATGHGSAQQVDILSYSHINQATESNRYYAHAFMAWIFYGFVMYMILRENIFYINLRQAFLLSPFYANRISSRTVLFISVPNEYLDTARIRKVFGDSVKNVWINGDTEKLDDLVKERDDVAMKLEKAEVKLIKLANAERVKLSKKNKDEPVDRAEVPADAESGSLASRWVPDKKRPTHRLGALGLVGKKVDTINWCRTELERLIPAVEAAQVEYRAGNFKKIPSVFIEFHRQADAESAYQVLAHHQALRMTPKYIGITPGEVVWTALKVSWWQRVIRRFAVLGFITALIIFWAVPVAVVGAISNVKYLSSISFLTWINLIPAPVLGLISGLLPSVALSILMSLVPIIMRLCAKLSGEPSLSRVELFTQNAYFAFQLIQVFLITTVSSSASSVGAQIAANPGSVTTVLAENLPKSSNFYISYFIVQGLGFASSALSQIVGFVIFTIMYKFLAGTPRALYKKWANLSAISWGSVLPVYTNIAVISITYAAIAPLMLGFATIGLSLFYLAWRYNVFFVTDTHVDTRGLIYPRALKQLFSGIYIAELCMIGLFAASVAIGPLILMIIFLIFTILFHSTINSAIDPLLYNLPRTLGAEAEWRSIDVESPGAQNGEKDGSPVAKKVSSGETAVVGKKPGFFSKFLKPWQYCDYETMRKLVPHDHIDVNNLYTEEIERNAYFPPSVGSATPLLWIPEDSMGISKQEVRDTSKVIPITDEGCTLNDKNKLEWDTETVRPPVWEEKIYY